VSGNDGNEGARESLINDVSAVPLSELVASSDSALTQSLQRILDELERSAQAISGWASYVD
jgi:FXSXX-COOH protein